MFPLHATRQAEAWPEDSKRRRTTMSIDEAIALLRSQTRRKDRLVMVEALEALKAKFDQGERAFLAEYG